MKIMTLALAEKYNISIDYITCYPRHDIIDIGWRPTIKITNTQIMVYDYESETSIFIDISDPECLHKIHQIMVTKFNPLSDC